MQNERQKHGLRRLASIRTARLAIGRRHAANTPNVLFFLISCAAQTLALNGNAPMLKNEWTIPDNAILYEDEAILVIEKPYALPSQPTLDPLRDNAYYAVERFLSKRSTSPVYVGLHHRLDALTSGVLLLSKSKDANPSLARQFQNHTIQKSYVAICNFLPHIDKNYQTPNTSWIIDAPIGELPGKIQKFGVEGKKRKAAKTRVTCQQIVELRDVFLGVYRCEPITGRTHQIRVHLSHLGLPIVEDPLYGTKSRALTSILPGRMCLHAESITFLHPLTQSPMTISAPLPQAFLKFLQKARALESHWKKCEK